jgi:hypothetical protein
MNATHDIETNSVRVSAHARLRGMQRLGVIDGVAEHIRGLLDRAEPAEVGYVQNAPAYEVGNVTIVLDPGGEVVQTVFEKEVADG